MKNILIIFIILGLSACAVGPSQQNFKEVASVALIHNGKKVKTITVKDDENLIQILNNMKVVQETGSVPRFEWDYKLGLYKPNSRADVKILWLYSSKSGQLIRLTKVKTPLYQIDDVDGFNQILGIGKQS